MANGVLRNKKVFNCELIPSFKIRVNCHVAAELFSLGKFELKITNCFFQSVYHTESKITQHCSCFREVNKQFED